MYIIIYMYAWLLCVYVHCRCVHAFTCAGILPSQYNHFSEFSGMGVVGKRYIGTGKHIALHLCIN